MVLYARVQLANDISSVRSYAQFQTRYHLVQIGDGTKGKTLPLAVIVTHGKIYTTINNVEPHKDDL